MLRVIAALSLSLLNVEPLWHQTHLVVRLWLHSAAKTGMAIRF